MSNLEKRDKLAQPDATSEWGECFVAFREKDGMVHTFSGIAGEVEIEHVMDLPTGAHVYSMRPTGETIVSIRFYADVVEELRSFYGGKL